jgi:prepilin-type N-terminal cleavage/methylation domain-containing protein
MIHHKQQPASPSSQSGFTIVESLIAIVVAAILLSAIAPVIILSVATRVQSRRIELATDGAKAYIDGVRSGRITAPPITKKSASATTDPAPPDAPSGTLTCTNSNDYCSSATPASTNLYCINGDNNNGCTNNSNKDLIVQAFGYNSVSTDAQEGYKLGVRVYRADAFKSGITLKALKDVKQQNTFTGGTGLTSIQAPLVEFTTEISNKSTSFGNFCDRLKPPDPSKPNTQSEC